MEQLEEHGAAAPEPKNKTYRKGFAPGFIMGTLSGILIAWGVFVAGSKLYMSQTGNYLILGPDKVSKASGSEVLNGETVDKINNLMAYVDLYYNDTYQKEDIQEAIYKGTLEGLGDPYSTYYTEDEYKDLQISTKGNYYGIGAGLTQDSDTMEVTVSKVYDGTPAQKAGILEGDQIVKVDQYKATEMELSELVKKIRGKEGTEVHLTIFRSSTEKTLEMDVERKNVDLPSVDSKMLESQIGYIQISEFQSNTAKQFHQALEELNSRNMKGLIVDVRANPGGVVTSVVEILDEILPEGTVVYTEDKYGKRETYTSDKNCIELPMVVLVDGNSASAAEIFAGAVKDYDYGTLIGTKTFGKGIVQTVFPLKDGSAVKLTTAKYYTPKGNYIHKTGIEPDIELEYKYSGPTDQPYSMEYDNQLQKAVSVLEGEISQ